MWLLTPCIQKNHQKYTDLSYCLQAVEAGIVAEQLRFTARCFALFSELHLRFLDSPLHDLLGLNPCEESIYAITILNTKPPAAFTKEIPAKQVSTHVSS